MSGKPTISTGRWIFIALLAAGMLALCYIIAKGNLDRPAPAQGGSFYRADAPLATLPQPLLAGLVLLTPEQMAQAPEVDGFQSPCGAPNGAMSYDAQPFGAPNDKRGGRHLGQDLNGIGGENSDLGEPVRAAARGLVTYCGDAGPGWGNIVVLAHRLPGSGRIVQTLYAHLDSIAVRFGEHVARGRRIGSIGTAGGHYLAHLHFEAIDSLCTEAGMPGYSPQGTMNRLDPQELIAKHPAPAWADSYETLRRMGIGTQARQSAAPTTSPALPKGSIPINPSQFLQP